jgi:3-oxo-5-alpha-steroid 4-dehydrogenase 1
MAALFLIHYFQRSFIFPLLIKGKSKMPIAIILMGATFNIINGILIGLWLFEYSHYTLDWLNSPQFIIGTLIFLFGMGVNLHSDYIIRHLRKPGDTRHYIPKGGMFKYVSSANYYGEITEWFGFAILTWSLPGALFCIWTFANLAPRANSLYKKYQEEFGEEFTKLKRKRVIPFIY